jgi:hypothetical protein
MALPDGEQRNLGRPPKETLPPKTRDSWKPPYVRPRPLSPLSPMTTVCDHYQCMQVAIFTPFTLTNPL